MVRVISAAPRILALGLVLILFVGLVVAAPAQPKTTNAKGKTYADVAKQVTKTVSAKSVIKNTSKQITETAVANNTTKAAKTGTKKTSKEPAGAQAGVAASPKKSGKQTVGESAGISANNAAGNAASLPQAVLNAIAEREDRIEIPISKELSRIFFIDYKGPVHTGTGTDCGPDSGSSRKIRGGIKWTSFPVNYQIDASASGIDLATAKQAVVNAFNTWDAEEHPSGQLFTEGTPAQVTVGWSPLDGTGSVLAVTGVTYYVATKTIVNAAVSYDSGDAWAVYPSLGCSSQGSAFDVEDIGAHEIGHVLGLDHVRKLADSALTMYPTAAPGETLKRTLGIGDKKGLDALY